MSPGESTRKRKRGRPRKYPGPNGDTDEDDGDDGGVYRPSRGSITTHEGYVFTAATAEGTAEEEEEGLAAADTEETALSRQRALAKKRREEAYERRKWEEEEAKRAYLAAAAASRTVDGDVDGEDGTPGRRRRGSGVMPGKREVGGLVDGLVAKRRRVSQSSQPARDIDDENRNGNPGNDETETVDLEAIEAAHIDAEQQRQLELPQKREAAAAAHTAREIARKARTEERARAKAERAKERKARRRLEADKNAKLVAGGLARWSDFEDEDEDEGESSEEEKEMEEEEEMGEDQEMENEREERDGIDDHNRLPRDQFRASGPLSPPDPDRKVLKHTTDIGPTHDIDIPDYNPDKYLDSSSPTSANFPDPADDTFADYNGRFSFTAAFNNNTYDQHDDDDDDPINNRSPRFHPPYGHTASHRIPFSVLNDFAVIIPPTPRGPWRNLYTPVFSPLSPEPAFSPSSCNPVPHHTPTAAAAKRGRRAVKSPEKTFRLGRWPRHDTEMVASLRLSRSGGAKRRSAAVRARRRVRVGADSDADADEFDEDDDENSGEGKGVGNRSMRGMRGMGRRVRTRRVQLKPGMWGEVEIDDDDDDDEDGDDDDDDGGDNGRSGTSGDGDGHTELKTQNQRSVSLMSRMRSVRNKGKQRDVGIVDVDEGDGTKAGATGRDLDADMDECGEGDAEGGYGSRYRRNHWEW